MINDPQTGYAAVNGLRLYYEIHGSGQPLVLLHGAFGSTDMFSDIVPQLAQDRQVILVDQQAHGRTADRDRPLWYESLGDDVAALIQHLGFEQADVLGYSMGGAAALRTAIQHPRLVRKLVIVSATFSRDGWYPEILAILNQIDASFAEVIKDTPMYHTYASIAPNPDNFPVLCAKMGDMERREYDWSAEVAQLEAPTLLVLGDADGIAPAYAARFFELLGGGTRDGGWDGSGMANSQLAILPGTTHYNSFASPLLAPMVTMFLDAPMPDVRSATDGWTIQERPAHVDPVKVETHIHTVSSRDGTPIAFDQVGNGPPLILVGGAFQHRALDSETARLSELLAPHFTVYHYDRRGRGESGDTQPYAVEREIDDIAALINAAGGAAFVYGMSSGAVLALHAAAQLGPARITRLVLYEPPFNTDADADKQEFAAYKAQIAALLQENRRGDAVAFFISSWAAPDMLAAMRQSPEWPLMEAVAPTLAYDNAVMGDGAVPPAIAAAIRVPVLILDGEVSMDFMQTAANDLARAIPHAERQTLAGQTHGVKPEVLAPVLVQFFGAVPTTGAGSRS